MSETTAICSKCGKTIRISTNSYIVEGDGKYTHKKCIEKVTGEDKEKLRRLKDKIQWYIDTENRNTNVSSYNWINIMKKIKELRLSGYTYDEIEYALDVCVDKMSGFYGFGAVVNRIYPIIRKKRQMESLCSEPERPEIEYVYKVNQDVIDF